MRLLVCLAVFACLPGCLTTGRFDAATHTTVSLDDGDFRLVARNVGGEASAMHLFGFSAGSGTSSLVRVGGARHLHQEALRNLWTSVEATTGDTRGRRLALVNVRRDHHAINAFVVVIPTVSIRADVVEFVSREAMPPK